MQTKVSNPVGWFEIPVRDMQRAKKFYEEVLGIEISVNKVMGSEMGWFPMADGSYGSSGSLVISDGQVMPTTNGTVVYFTAPDIDAALERVAAHGGKILVPKTDIGEYGWIAHLEDTEGNRIALHRNKEMPAG